MNTNDLKDAGAQHVANMLKKNTTLTLLDLSYNEIGDAGLRCICNALEVNNTLLYLNLWENTFGDAGVECLYNALGINTTLQRIDIGDDDVGDMDTKYFGDIKARTTWNAEWAVEKPTIREKFGILCGFLPREIAQKILLELLPPHPFASDILYDYLGVDDHRTKKPCVAP